MTIRSLTLAIAGLFTVLAQAAPLPTTAKAAQPEDLPTAVQRQLESREAIQKKADEAQAALRAWYQAALDAVKKDALSKGDLDGVVAADAERDRTERDLTEAEKNALPKVSRAVRDKYDEARALQTKQLNGAVTASLQAYSAVLEGLEKRLTQQGKLEDAIATRVERAKVGGLLAGGSIPPAAPPEATPPVPKPDEPAPPAPKPEPAPAPAAPATPAAFNTVTGVSKENPGWVEVEKLTPVKLVAGPPVQPELWGSIPPELDGATIFQQSPGQPSSAGVAAYKTIEPGRVYLALNYEYQGNSGGGWQNERWQEQDFIKNGWARVAGLQLISSANKGRKFIVMTKVLEKGETGRLRCNKYEPPYFITFHPGSAQ
jgi:hypothetical protein